MLVTNTHEVTLWRRLTGEGNRCGLKEDIILALAEYRSGHYAQSSPDRVAVVAPLVVSVLLKRDFMSSQAFFPDIRIWSPPCTTLLMSCNVVVIGALPTGGESGRWGLGPYPE